MSEKSRNLAHFRQGNGVDYSREEDEAERRVKAITSVRDICPPVAPTPGAVAPPCTRPTLPIWESGLYQYDFAGNIIAIGGDRFYYDRLSRLKSATINRHPHDSFLNGLQPAGFVTLNYTYDIFGNITDRRLVAHLNYTVGQNPLELFGGRSYNAGVNPVTDNQIHEVGFLYDGNGNLISDGVKDFIYDELNQQVEVRGVVANCAAAGQGTGSFSSTANAGEGAGATPASVLCYAKGPLIEKNLYGPDGMRAVREVYVPVTNLPKRTTYARLGGNVVKEYTEEYRAITSTAPEISHEKAYVYGPLGLLATEELCSFNCKADESAGINVTRYYELDHLGTIRAISDHLGHLVSTSDYEPFGLELKSADAAFPWWSDTSSNTHKFTGHERDEEAGEDYMKARMYVLSTARFPQIDARPSNRYNPQDWNPYIYVYNNPVHSNDPSGLSSSIEPIYRIGGVTVSANQFANLSEFFADVTATGNVDFMGMSVNISVTRTTTKTTVITCDGTVSGNDMSGCSSTTTIYTSLNYDIGIIQEGKSENRLGTIEVKCERGIIISCDATISGSLLRLVAGQKAGGDTKYADFSIDALAAEGSLTLIFVNAGNGMVIPFPAMTAEGRAYFFKFGVEKEFKTESKGTFGYQLNHYLLTANGLAGHMINAKTMSFQESKFGLASALNGDLKLYWKTEYLGTFSLNAGYCVSCVGGGGSVQFKNGGFGAIGGGAGAVGGYLGFQWGPVER